MLVNLTYRKNCSCFLHLLNQYIKFKNKGQITEKKLGRNILQRCDDLFSVAEQLTELLVVLIKLFLKSIYVLISPQDHKYRNIKLETEFIHVFSLISCQGLCSLQRIHIRAEHDRSPCAMTGLDKHLVRKTDISIETPLPFQTNH